MAKNGNIQRKENKMFEKIVNDILIENPDDLFSYSGTDAITFVYFKSGSALINNIKFRNNGILARLNSDMNNKEELDIKKAFLKKNKISTSSPVVVYSMGKDGNKQFYINGKVIKQEAETPLQLYDLDIATHGGLMGGLVRKMLDYNGYDDNFYDGGREAGDLSGRIELKKIDDVPNSPMVSFWNSEKSVSEKDISNIIKLTSKQLKWPKEINIETSMGDEGRYYTPDQTKVVKIKTSKPKEKTVIKVGNKLNTIDGVRNRKWPGLKFEQIVEAILSEL